LSLRATGAHSVRFGHALHLTSAWQLAACRSFYSHSSITRASQRKFSQATPREVSNLLAGRTPRQPGAVRAVHPSRMTPRSVGSPMPSWWKCLAEHRTLHACTLCTAAGRAANSRSGDHKIAVVLKPAENPGFPDKTPGLNRNSPRHRLHSGRSRCGSWPIPASGMYL
jgi:hypothetical protein